jgi:hypothetical protein
MQTHPTQTFASASNVPDAWHPQPWYLITIVSSYGIGQSKRWLDVRSDAKFFAACVGEFESYFDGPKFLDDIPILSAAEASHGAPHALRQLSSTVLDLQPFHTAPLDCIAINPWTAAFEFAGCRQLFRSATTKRILPGKEK